MVLSEGLNSAYVIFSHLFTGKYPQVAAGTFSLLHWGASDPMVPWTALMSGLGVGSMAAGQWPAVPGEFFYRIWANLGETHSA